MKHYIMIGAPVTAVRTPPLLLQYQRTIGVASSIDTQHIDTTELAAFMQSIRENDAIDGLLVTMPHKRTILRWLDVLDPTARATRSVNAVKRLIDGRLVGAQFDGPALVNALLARGVPLHDCKVWQIGVGGAGLAIALALHQHGVGSLILSDKEPQHLVDALEQLRGMSEPHHLISTTPSSSEHHQPVDLLINATPLGMNPTDPSPFTESQVRKSRWVADIVADPPATRLAALADLHGVPLITGLDMVRGQIEIIGAWLNDVETA